MIGRTSAVVAVLGLAVLATAVVAGTRPPPAVHGAFAPSKHGAFAPSKHGAFAPSKHGAFAPSEHGASAPIMHSAHAHRSATLSAPAPHELAANPQAAPVPASPSTRTIPQSSATRLESLLAEAQREPAAVVALLVEGSRVLATLPPESARRLGDTLEPFARRAFFGPERLPDMERLGLVLHSVAKGENPTVIAARHDVGAGLLPYLNEAFDAKKLRVGQKVKVLDVAQGELEIGIDRSTFRLAAWRRLAQGGRVLVLFAPVGIGAADSPTPTGRTRITKRVLEPSWTDPDTRQVFAPKDPRNVLGGYWIALDPDGLGGRRGIGLHGYTGSPADDWLEKPGSHGCIRMLQQDVDRVYHLATEGTVVEIR